MTETALLKLPYVAENQAQPHLPHNAALDTIDTIIGAQAGTLGLGSLLTLRSVEVELTALSGADVTVPALVPAGAILFAVTSWVPAVGPGITGATGYTVEIPGGSQFGTGLGVAAGSSYHGAVGPFAIYAPTDIRVVSEGGAFTGGTLRLAARFILPEVTP